MTTEQSRLQRSPNPPYEPEATCDACGASGTVGRVVRTDAGGADLDVRRFCLACWTRESQPLITRWEEEREIERRDLGHAGASSGSIYATSATWDNAAFLIAGIKTALQSGDPDTEISPDALTRFAAEIVARAPEMIGPMPEVVAQFVQRYGANAS